MDKISWEEEKSEDYYLCNIQHSWFNKYVGKLQRFTHNPLTFKYREEQKGMDKLFSGNWVNLRNYEVIF